MSSAEGDKIGRTIRIQSLPLGHGRQALSSQLVQLDLCEMRRLLEPHFAGTGATWLLFTWYCKVSKLWKYSLGLMNSQSTIQLTISLACLLIWVSFLIRVTKVLH